jgi:3-hydroxyisobutyrate dehydrogenase-like beta-hydroxyacid dehydrogenase
VCPPEFAEGIAEQVAKLGFRGAYVDANAISPERALRIGALLEEAGTQFVDGGIIGPPATKRGQTWLYLSGDGAADIAPYFSAGPIETEVLDGGVGCASALKMCFAAYSKGTVALASAVLAAAGRLGVFQDLARQWERNGPSLPKMESEIQRAGPKAWRYIAEMEEIAATFESAGVTGEFHHAAAEVFRRFENLRHVSDRVTID